MALAVSLEQTGVEGRHADLDAGPKGVLEVEADQLRDLAVPALRPRLEQEDDPAPGLPKAPARGRRDQAEQHDGVLIHGVETCRPVYFCSCPTVVRAGSSTSFRGASSSTTGRWA